MDFSEHKIPTPDGPKIYARDYAPVGAARRLPVLCLHGLTRNSADFEVVAPMIAARGRRVIVIDARGRGQSDNDPDATRYRPDVFLGTSMGGIMTMLASIAAPARIAAAILNDIGPEIAPGGIARIAGYVGKLGPYPSWNDAAEAIKASQSIAFPGKDDAFWKTFARRVARERRDGRIEFAYDPAIALAFATPSTVPPTNMVPLFEALAAVPILLIRGALSDLLSPDGVATMKRVKPDMEFAEVPNVGHAPTLEEPQAWQAIADFLSRVE
jgi:pimeloyl-ACP methyl ester carboxylesterase